MQNNFNVAYHVESITIAKNLNFYVSIKVDRKLMKIWKHYSNKVKL